MSKREVIVVRREVLAQTRGYAENFRQKLAQRGTLIVNVLSSPGSGKTSMLAAIAGELSMAILVGDIATDRDAQRLVDLAPTAQLTTGGACHLELPLVESGWQAIGEPEVDFLFIENVGNLVCPASHDLGEHLRVILLSTTEGDDKPAKYPKAFRTSHALVISKIDLLPHVPFDIETATSDARSIRPELEVFPISTRPATGLSAVCQYLQQARESLLSGKELKLNR